MIRILMGRAHRLMAPIAEEIGRLHAQDKPCLLLVPEQFTLQAERELLDRLHLKGFFTIDVLSPSRLSHRVLSAVGADEREPLSASGRLMAISCALERCEDRLRYYRASSHRRGFAEKLAAIVTDMKRGGLSPEALAAYAQSLPTGASRDKLDDLATMYAAYEAQLGGRFGDGEDQLRYLAARLPESHLLDGQNVFVYGFDTLPEQLMQLLCAVASLCESLTVSLLCDSEGAPDGDLYAPVWQGVGRFREALRERGLTLAVDRLPDAPLPHAPAIRHLDAALFAHPETKFAGEQHSVFLSQALSPYEEATLASRQILQLCAGGMDIERIAVLYPEQNGYAFAVSAALRDSGLPFYTDAKLPAASHGLVRFLLSSLRAVAGDYRDEDMLSVMKSGYAPLSFDEACTLETYMLEFGVRRKQWTQPFRKGDEARVERLEPLRLRLMQPLTALREGIVKAKDARGTLEAVMRLLTDVDAYAALQAEEDALVAEGLLVRAGQNSQIWQAILTLTDQLYALSDGARIPLKYIADRFDCGFSAISLAALPPADHMLHAGVLGHFLSGEMDAVFLLGLNDGVLGKRTDSLLTEEERAQTQAATASFLGMTDESRALFAKLDVKRAMTLPKQFLFLSYAKTDPSGTALRPLSLLSALEKRLFNGLEALPAEGLPMSAVQALDELSSRLRAYADGGELPKPWRDRLAKLLRCPSTADAAASLLRAADYRLDALPLEPSEARRLFNERTLSVSRLEDYADCPFKHFVQHGLRPAEIREWKVLPAETGTFYHQALKNFAELAERTPAYPHIGREQTDALFERAVKPLMEEQRSGRFEDSQRSQAMFTRAKQVVHRACSTLTDQLASGEFQLYKSEARFGYEGADSLPPIVLHLHDGTEVTLRGSIDRIDRYLSPEETYLRVIDYKSSHRTTDPTELWNGLQLQLPLYLAAAVKGVRGSSPAGVFYFHISDPLAAIESDEHASAERAIAEKLRLEGLALADENVLSAMDSSDARIVLPKTMGKDGFVKNAKVLDKAQFGALLTHSRQKAEQLADDLYAGKNEISPVRSNDALPCGYCTYREVCGFHADEDASAERQLEKVDNDQFRELLTPSADKPQSL